MFNSMTGVLSWPVDTKGYEIVVSDARKYRSQTNLEANFLRPDKQEEFYARRGIVRAKGGEVRYYNPIEDTPGLARRLGRLFDEDPRSNRPSDDDVIAFVNEYGLLIAADEMPVRDMIYTAKYLYLFTLTVDRGDKYGARDLFNERILPLLTLRLVGSRSTANWSLEPQPTNLISAAWLQVAQELTHGKRLKKCEAPDCLEWFPERSNKRFCNNRCKMAYHRAAQPSA